MDSAVASPRGHDRYLPRPAALKPVVSSSGDDEGVPMKRRLAVVIGTVAMLIVLAVPGAALAGGDQVHRPSAGDWQNVGDDPLDWQLRTNR